ncbi:MAG: TetR/AcrR family transcriptional regulator [Acidihalobacter sp.]|jgi:TetR/AcrR family transcriptional regulator, transcriptional repressor for nem operon|uniref:TetR/AcrR family transcriptional regulator n=1 Tax=Acidihalobacter sp. TaxID=1872108 RepID=UPI00307F9B8C
MEAVRHRCPETTRQRLLEAAHREIYEHGYQAASLDRILADTGLSKGALYHHFGTKQALGLAVVNEVIGTRMQEEWIEPIQQAQRPLQTIIELLGLKQKRATEMSIRLGCDLNNLMQEMSPLDEAFRQSLAKVITQWRATLESGLRRSREIGELRSGVDCARTALFVVAAIEGCVGTSKNQRSVEEHRDCLDGVKDYLYSLYAEGTR